MSVALVLLSVLVAGCGSKAVPESGPGPSTGSDPLTQLFRDGVTPLLRTDFSDDAAWERVAQAVTAAADLGADADPDDPDDGGLYPPNIKAISDRAYEGATGQSLAATRNAELLGYVLLADDRTMREAAAGGELTAVYVDLSVAPEDAEEFGFVYGREFRCEVGQIASIEANLSIANMDFNEFADSVDGDGVFRGFPE